MKTVKFFVRSLIGLIAGSAIGAASTGSLADFATMLGMMVVCTAGLGLLVIVPAAYLLGLILTLWWIPLGNTPWTRPPRSQSARSTRRGRRALVEYIRASAANGGRPEDLRQELLEAGWKEDAVLEAFATAGLAAPSPGHHD